MQIREQGKKIQLIRTHYVKEKKRTEGKVFDSFDKYLSAIPEDIRRQLNNEEVEQLESYLSKRAEKLSVESSKYYLSATSENIRRAVNALSVDEVAATLTLEKAAAIYAAMDELRKALKKAGYAKQKQENKQVPIDPRQTSIILDDQSTKD